MKNLIMPTLCLNGTSKKDLLAQYVGCMNAVQDAIRVLADNSPHERDYQLGPGKFTFALDAHGERLNALEAVRAELEMIAEHIAA